MKRVWLAVVIAFWAVHISLAQAQRCQPTRHASLPTVTKRTYDDARKALIAAGWKPFQMHKVRDDVDISEGNGPIFWQRNYVEVEACSGTGLAPCAFLFIDTYGNRLRISTAGEEVPEAKVHAIVTEVRYVCD